MKTILVTGAAGYIGRHVVKKALDMGYRVIASDFAFKGVDERAEFCDVPIFSGDKNIYTALGKPDVCIHMAWRDGFRHNAPSHMKDLSSHVTFLNNMAAGGLSDLTVMGTMHEVGYWEGAIEDDTPCNPLSQYGIAKNALRQSMMLSLQGSSCNLHWLRAYYITGDEAHGSSIFAKIAQAGVQGGPAGAAAEAAVQYRKEVLVVAIAVMLLPVLVLIMLPGAIFGTLTQPSTAVNDDLEIAANVIQLRNAVSDILQEAYEDTLAEIESERASRTYSDIDDSVGGHVSYNAFQLISMYCAYQGEDDYTKISLSNLSEQIQAHRTEYYTYTISEEVRTEPVQKEVRGQTITVQEDHTYTIFTLSYVGDDYFADTVWQLDDKQKSYADAYAHNLTVYLHEIEEREGITILGQINDSLIDDNSPAPSGGFGNPFNDPNWEQHITSFFGKREDVGIPGKDTTNHNGLDIAYPYGTPILAVEAGTVIKAGYHVSYGNYLVINHGGGYCTLYAHCSQLLAQVGDTVNKYDTIAKVGATGDVTGNHLHICVIIDGVYVNPKGYLH